MLPCVLVLQSLVGRIRAGVGPLADEGREQAGDGLGEGENEFAEHGFLSGLGRPAAVLVGTGGEGPVGCDDFVGVIFAHGFSDERLVVGFGERRAFVGQLGDGFALVDGFAEVGFVVADLGEQFRGDFADGGPLIGEAEDAGHAGHPAPAQAVGGVGDDVEFLHDVPDLFLGPVDDHAPVVNVALVGVGAVLFHFGVLGASGGFLAAFAGQEQDFLALEGRVVVDGDGSNVDLQGGGTPALAEVCRDLGEHAAGADLAFDAASGASSAVQVLEADGGGTGVVLGHFLLEAAVSPLEQQLEVEGFGEGPAVALGARPVHEGGIDARLAVDVLVHQDDLAGRDAIFEKFQDEGDGILAAAERYKNVVVPVQGLDAGGVGAAVGFDDGQIGQHGLGPYGFRVSEGKTWVILTRFGKFSRFLALDGLLELDASEVEHGMDEGFGHFPAFGGRGEACDGGGEVFVFEEVGVDFLLVDEFEEGDVFEHEDFVTLEVGTIRVVQLDDEVLADFLGLNDLVVIGVGVAWWNFGFRRSYFGWANTVDPGAGRIPGTSGQVR